MKASSKIVERLGKSKRDLSATFPVPEGGRLVELDKGDPSFDTPDYIVQAAARAVKDGYTHYPPILGDGQLREAIAAYQSRTSHVPVSGSEVLVTAGGTSAITSAMLALLDEGDEVILIDPTYSLYADAARVAGASVVSVPCTREFRMDIDALQKAVTPSTRMLVLNYPANPTGQLLRPEELEWIGAIANESDLVVLSDEVYDQLVFSGEHLSIYGHPALTDRTILVHSFSKTYAMPGWRVGYAVARGNLLKAVSAVHQRTGGHVSNVGQRAALEALTNESEDRKWRTWMLGQYRKQRKAMCDQLAEVPGLHVLEPQAAFYAWVRYDAPVSAAQMKAYLGKWGLATRAGSEFGSTGESHLRFSYSPSVEVITDGIDILKAAMKVVNDRGLSSAPPCMG